MSIDIEKIRLKKRRGEPLTDGEYKALDAWWKEERSKPAPIAVRRKKSSYLNIGIFADITGGHDPNQKNDPTELRCSFCGRPVSEVTLTRANQPQFLRTEELTRDERGDLDIQEKMIIRNQEVIACEDHVLLIKPRINKQGEYVSHNLKFPQSLEEL